VSECPELKTWLGNPSIGTTSISNPYGPEATNLNAPTNSVDWFFHTDYCCHRPTIIEASVGYSAITQGTSRVFVESRQDRSAYVWAEFSVSQITFPSFVSLNHSVYQFFGETEGPVVSPDYQFNSTIVFQIGLLSFPNYGSFLGVTGAIIDLSRGGEDDDAYIKEPWPSLDRFLVGANDKNLQKYVGRSCRIKAGYRANGQDTVLIEYGGIRDLESSFRVGCFLADIEAGRPQVRCGLESQSDERPTVGISVPATTSFYSIPFSVPLSIFESQADFLAGPVFVGGSVIYDASTTIERGLWGGRNIAFQTAPFTGPPTPPSTQFEVATSAAVDFSHALPDSQSLTPQGYESSFRWCPSGSPLGAVTSSETGAVTRPDRQLYKDNAVYSGVSWHASDIVRQGSPLAVANALHKIEVVFDDEFDLQNVLTQNLLTFIGGQLRAPWTIVPVVYPFLKGTYTLTPLGPSGERLAPNRFHCFSNESDTNVSFTHEPPVGTERRGDYTQETFVQMWATTSISKAQRSRGPLQIPLPESGMLTQDYDQFTQGQWNVVDYETLFIELGIRQRVKMTFSNVKFYSVGQVTDTFNGPFVLCGEFVSRRNIEINKEDAVVLSNGGQLTVSAISDIQSFTSAAASSFPGRAGLIFGPGTFGNVSLRASLFS